MINTIQKSKELKLTHEQVQEMLSAEGGTIISLQSEGVRKHLSMCELCAQYELSLLSLSESTENNSEFQLNADHVKNDPTFQSPFSLLAFLIGVIGLISGGIYFFSSDMSFTDPEAAAITVKQSNNRYDGWEMGVAFDVPESWSSQELLIEELNGDGVAFMMGENLYDLNQEFPPELQNGETFGFVLVENLPIDKPESLEDQLAQFHQIGLGDGEMIELVGREGLITSGRLPTDSGVQEIQFSNFSLVMNNRFVRVMVMGRFTNDDNGANQINQLLESIVGSMQPVDYAGWDLYLHDNNPLLMVAHPTEYKPSKAESYSVRFDHTEFVPPYFIQVDINRNVTQGETPEDRIESFIAGLDQPVVVVDAPASPLYRPDIVVGRYALPQVGPKANVFLGTVKNPNLSAQQPYVLVSLFVNGSAADTVEPKFEHMLRSVRWQPAPVMFIDEDSQETYAQFLENAAQEFEPVAPEQTVVEGVDYGIAKEVLNVTVSEQNTTILLRAHISPRWRMSADWQLTPPNGASMNSLEHPQIVTQDLEPIAVKGMSSPPLAESAKHGLTSDIQIVAERLPPGTTELRLLTDVELLELRSFDPLVLDISGRDRTNSPAWSIDHTAKIGAISYTFNKAQIVDGQLQLFSDGVNEFGYQTSSFYTMTKFEPPTPEAYANGGSGIFYDRANPLAVLSLNESLGDQLELYFRASVLTLIPHETVIVLSDYDIDSPRLIAPGEMSEEERLSGIRCSEGGTGIFTPEDLICSFDKNFEAQNIEYLTEDIVLTVAQNRTIAPRWSGGAFIYHIPSVTMITFDFCGRYDQDFSQYLSEEEIQIFQPLLDDVELMHKIERLVTDEWGADQACASQAQEMVKINELEVITIDDVEVDVQQVMLSADDTRINLSLQGPEFSTDEIDVEKAAGYELGFQPILQTPDGEEYFGTPSVSYNQPLKRTEIELVFPPIPDHDQVKSLVLRSGLIMKNVSANRSIELDLAQRRPAETWSVEQITYLNGVPVWIKTVHYSETERGLEVGLVYPEQSDDLDVTVLPILYDEGGNALNLGGHTGRFTKPSEQESNQELIVAMVEYNQPLIGTVLLNFDGMLWYRDAVEISIDVDEFK